MRTRFVLMITVVLSLTVAGLAGAQVNQQAIDEVKAGTQKTARASWWGWSPVESTEALQTALNSGAEKVIVEKMPGPWIVDPIFLPSNIEVIFEPGVEVVAKRGSFKGGNDSLFSAKSQQNITLRGPGATLRMWRDDYDKAPYTKAEWRHVLDFKSCANVRIYGLRLVESGGDGIYLGSAVRGVTNRNFHIKDVVCDKNYRQGISIITAENLTIEDCTLTNTGGTAPMAGIDFEPNHPHERLVNCVMKNCLVQGNKGAGIVLYLPPMDATSEPLSLTFENCRTISDGYCGLGVYTGNSPATAVRGSIKFVGCTVIGSAGSGIIIANKPVEGCELSFENCQLINVAPGKPDQTPITFIARPDATEPVGGVTFKDVLIRDALNRQPMSYTDATGLAGVKQVTGNLIFEKGNQKVNTPLTEELLSQWLPFVEVKRVARVSLEGLALEPVAPAQPAAMVTCPLKVRNKGLFGVYARQGETVKLKLGYGQVGKYGGSKMPVLVTTPDGKEVTKASVPFEEDAEVTFTAPVTGLLRVMIEPGANFGALLASSHPVGLLTDGGRARLYMTIGDLYFWVPAGTPEVALRAIGEGAGEAIRVILSDHKGQVIEDKDNIVNLHQFLLTPSPTAAGEFYKVTLAKPTNTTWEDNYMELVGVPPVLALGQGSLLKPVGSK